jgi:hypothetical protein
VLMAEAYTHKKNKFIREIDYVIRIFKTNPQEPKNKDALFQKLFELMTFNCGDIWKVVLDSTRYTKTVGNMILTTTIKSLSEQLQSFFYSKSKWIKTFGSKDLNLTEDLTKETARIVNESYRIDPIPSKLFLEFLLFVAGQIVILKKGGENVKIDCLGTLVRRSDQESVLNIAQETDRFFMITTEPTTRELFQQILEIYKACGIAFTGNISISHIIGELCEGITGSVMQTESSQSQSLDETLEVRSVFEETIINKYNNDTEAIVETSPPPVKSRITKTKPISITRKPALSLANSRTKARPDATILKPKCQFGDNCNRRRDALDSGESHFAKFRHPPNFIHIEDRPRPPWRTGGGSGKSKRSRRRLSTKRTTRRTTRRR